jgi:NAD(P)-dependent dehydrogenase (short-subunit alcohol dehydrogenase family)
VINIVGGMARTPNPAFAIGGSVNSALANFSKALAGQGLVDDVNVNTIHPGQTKTERLTEMMNDQAAAQGKTPEQVLAETIQRQGLRRLGTPEDVAELAVFLCLPQARHIQGTAISVDGGGTKGLY